MSTHYSSYANSSGGGSMTASIADAVVDTMVRWPMRMTGATVDLMVQGVQAMTGTGGSRASRGNGSSISYDSTTSSQSASSASPSKSNSGLASLFSSQTSGTFDQDLSGDDLKYVFYSIVFTKPGCECILQKQTEDLVNYSADSSTYAAVKIAKFLDSARYGHAAKPQGWDQHTPDDAARKAGLGDKSEDKEKEKNGKGWRVSPEDQKYISFLYRVERRLPKQEEQHVRVERVTVERNTRVV